MLASSVANSSSRRPIRKRAHVVAKGQVAKKPRPAFDPQSQAFEEEDVTTHYNITVAEILEYEFKFELAEYLGLKLKDLNAYKNFHPEKTKEAARYVLKNVCTQWCRTHILDKSTAQRFTNHKKKLKELPTGHG